MISDHDERTLVDIASKKGYEKLYDYEVTVHMLTGPPITFTIHNYPFCKLDLIRNINSNGFIVVEDMSVSINMRNVTYIEVKEITND